MDTITRESVVASDKEAPEMEHHHDPAESVAALLAYGKRNRRHKPNTTKKYTHALREFLEWCEHVGLADLAALTTNRIENDLLVWWADRFEARNGREPAAKTTNGLIDSLAALYNWLERQETWRGRNPVRTVERVRDDERPIDHLTDDELNRLLNDGPQTQQQRTVVWLLALTGMRVGEAASLRLQDVDLEAKTISIQASKSGIRVLPIIPELVPELRRWIDYLEARAGRKKQTLSRSSPFLATRNGTVMTEQQMWKATQIAADHAGIRRTSCHCLRRTLATRILNNGASIENVSATLGHRSISTTQKYYASINTRQAAAAALSHFS